MGGYLKDQSHIKAPKPGELKDENKAPRFTRPAADQGEAGEVPKTTEDRVKDEPENGDSVNQITNVDPSIPENPAQS